MKKEQFYQRLKEEVLIIDGAMGTMLQPHLKEGSCLDYANISHRDIVANVHRQYVTAGADIILSNTFGASRIKLREYALEGMVREINRAGVEVARQGAGGKAWVAGSIGPSGRLVEPLGNLTFDETYESYKEQAVALAEAGADLLILETFGDLKEAKIALMAARENTGLPIMVSMTFKEDFLTYTGTDPISAVTVLSSLGADALGVNCTTGPGPMLEVLGRMILATDKPLFVEPNAIVYGQGRDGAPLDVLPPDMARFGERFVEIGANVVGTCCGSTPRHTEHLRTVLKKKRPLDRVLSPCLRLSSRYRTVSVGLDHPFCIIGERINPTNRKDLSEELKEGKIVVVQEEGRSQESQGAHLLDINVGVPGIDEASVMRKVVRGIETATRIPLVIDSVTPGTVEAALREATGKVLINSVTGDAASLENILPLAARYGTGLICLAVDDEGIPQKAEERLRVLRNIVEAAEKAGIPRSNLICDCVTLTVSAQQKRAQETLRAINLVKQELKLPTVLGVSNISYGLPERTLINSTFLGMAMAAGLDAAIMNPGDTRMVETVKAASVLTLRDKDSLEYVKAHAPKKKKTATEAGPTIIVKDDEKRIYQSILSGNSEGIAGLIATAMGAGIDALDINNRLLIPAIEEIGKKYESKEIYLPQMLLSAETFQAAFRFLEPHFNTADIKSPGTILLSTVRGDVHDIGKNIVALFLKNHGFKVIDLGKNVTAEEVLRKAIEYKADVIGLSALMTTTMVEMPKVIELFKKEGVPGKIIIGGAVVTRKYAQDIGADAYAKDGVSAVDQVKGLFTPGKG